MSTTLTCLEGVQGLDCGCCGYGDGVETPPLPFFIPPSYTVEPPVCALSRVFPASQAAEMRRRAGSVGRQEMTQGIRKRRGLVSLNPSARPRAFPAELFARRAVGANSTSPSGSR